MYPLAYYTTKNGCRFSAVVLLEIRFVLFRAAAPCSALPVLWAGSCIWTANAGVAFFLFFIDVSDGEKQYRRYHNYRYYRSCIHRAALLSIISSQHNAQR